MGASAIQLRGDGIRDLIDRLVAEYAGAVSEGAVARTVWATRRDLIEVGVRDNLVAATEHVARRQLAHQVAVRHDDNRGAA